MKFQVGDKIKIYHPFMRMGRNHVGDVGVITELRRYPVSSKKIPLHPTHYVVKFDCYKIPHVYMRNEIEDSCEKVD